MKPADQLELELFPTKTKDIRATTDEVTALRAAGVEVVPVVTDRGDRATQSGSSPPIELGHWRADAEREFFAQEVQQ